VVILAMAATGCQLKIERSTGALRKQAVEAIFETANIPLLGKLDYFSTELFCVARDQLLD